MRKATKAQYALRDKSCGYHIWFLDPYGCYIYIHIYIYVYIYIIYIYNFSEVLRMRPHPRPPICHDVLCCSYAQGQLDCDSSKTLFVSPPSLSRSRRWVEVRKTIGLFSQTPGGSTLREDKWHTLQPIRCRPWMTMSY